MNNTLYSILFAVMATACGGLSSPTDEQLCQQAADFAKAYFNYDYPRAAELAMPESARWLQFAASNLTQADLDVINAAEEASVSIDDLTRINDSTVTVTIEVENILLKDTIGQPPHVVSEARYPLVLVSRDGRYLIKMEGLPQSERQSRD